MAQRVSRLDRNDVVRRAADSARRYLVSRESFVQSVQGVTLQLDEYSRAAYRIVRRHVVCRSAPGPTIYGLQPDSPTSPEGVDPWSAAASDLERTSRVLSACPSCQAEGARGECSSCGGTGTVYCWLTIREVTSVRVDVTSEYLATRLHPEVLSLEDFERNSDRYPAELESDSGWTSDFSGFPPLLQPRLDRSERVVSGRCQVFMARTYSIAYRTPQGRGAIDVAGRFLQVLPWSNYKPLQLRLAVLTSSAALVTSLAIGAGVLAAYVHSPSMSAGAAALIAGLVTALGFVIAFGSQRVWRSVRRRLPPWLGGSSLWALALAARRSQTERSFA
jgi:hypothetical protein